MPRCRAVVDKRFDYNTIQFKLEGVVEIKYDEEARSLDGPWLFPAYPGPRIQFGRADACRFWNHRYAAFTGAGVHELEDPAGVLSEPLQVPAHRVQSITTTMDDLINAASQQDELSRKKAVTILQLLLVEAAEIRNRAATGASSWVSSVVAQLLPADPRPDYTAIAGDLGMSLPTLRRRFREATGTPIHEYHLRLRVAEARRLLAESDYPIKKIAAELGYVDVFYFTRQFSKKAGVSPGVYRESVQESAAAPSSPESSPSPAGRTDTG